MFLDIILGISIGASLVLMMIASWVKEKSDTKLLCFRGRSENGLAEKHRITKEVCAALRVTRTWFQRLRISGAITTLLVILSLIF